MVYQGSYDLRRDVDKLKRQVDDGAMDSISYFLSASSPVITYDASYSPSNITFKSYKIENGTTDGFDCTLIIEGSVDGVTYTTIKEEVESHSITSTITNSYAYYRGAMIVDDNVLDYQTVRVVSSSDAYTVFLGNESQLIPCDSDGELISSFTFKVPYYCYKGTKKYPCRFYAGDSDTPSWITYTNRDADASNNGELNITVNDTPTENQGFLVLAFKVDDEVIYCILTYARTKEGVRGKDGVDGNGYHYIYYRTQTNVKPDTPVFGETVIIDNTSISGENLTGNEWFEEPVSPTAQFPYLWGSFRVFNGESKTWGSFCEPYLYDQYTYYGSNGGKGNAGVHGIDGSVLDGDAVEDKTTDVSSKAMNDSVPSNFVSQGYNTATYHLGGDDPITNTSYLNRQGNIVSFTLRGTWVQPTVTTPDGEYVTILTLESWAVPVADVFVRDAVQDKRYRIRNDNGTPKLAMWCVPQQNGVTHYLATTTIYFADDTNRPSSHIDLLTPNNIEQGGAISVQLLDDEDSSLGHKKVYFKVNGVIYQKETNLGGIASLNMNLYGNQQVAVWYDGYEYTNGEIQELGDNHKCESVFNVFVKSAFIKSIDFGNDESRGYYAEIRTNANIPLRYHDANLSIAGSETWTVQTDGEGRVYFDLMGYTDDVEVIVNIPSTNRVYDGATEKYVFLKSSKSTFSHNYYPTSISSNSNYVDLNVDNLRSIGDMKYVKTVEIPYNLSLAELLLNYDDLGIPLSAIIQRVEAEVRFCGLEGDKQLQRPSWKAPKVNLYVGKYSVEMNGRPAGVQCNAENCGKWKTVTYNTTLTNSAINPSNIMGDWKTLTLGLGDLTNLGGGNNHQDSGRFAVDHVRLNITYTADNDQSLIPSDTPSVNIYADDVEVWEHAGARYKTRIFVENEPVVGGDVNIHINGNDYSRTTDSNGEASIGINLPSGNYGVAVSYTDDEDVTTTKTAVIKIKPRIISTDLVKSYRCNIPYSVQVLSTSGEANPNQTVRFNVNGVTYDRTSNNDGIAKLNINLPVGTYVITTYYDSCSIADEIMVIPTIHSSDLRMWYRDGSRFEVLITDCEGEPVSAGEKVTFKANGVSYDRYTDDEGYTRISINLLPEDYIITTTYNGATVTNNIKVMPTILASDLTKQYRDSTPFTAKIVTTNNVPVVGAEVEFNINGVFYYRTTDSNGIASLNINLMPGTYIIVINGPNLAVTSNKIIITG